MLAPVTVWRELSSSELADWNQRLLREPSASVRQFPLLNEGHRVSGSIWITFPKRFASLIDWARRWSTTPRYLVHRSRDGKTSYSCIVSIGLPGIRFGCIVDGPINMDDSPMDPSVVRDLLMWARRNHYVALRVTHPDGAYLNALAALGNSDRTDGVPFYPYPISELYVNLASSEAAVLASFQSVARRNIRQAQEAGYDITVDHGPEALDKVWPVFHARAAQKGISYRTLKVWKLVMREAEPHQAATLYTAWRKGVPISAILVLRDRTTAHNVIGAIDEDALGDSPSPACLLHWSAMREAMRLGCRFYNLGTRSGSVYTFKSKFRPTERDWPAPLTFAISPRLYQVWRRLLPSVARFVTRHASRTEAPASEKLYRIT